MQLKSFDIFAPNVQSFCIVNEFIDNFTLAKASYQPDTASGNSDGDVDASMHFNRCLHRIARDKDKEAFVDIFEYFAPRIKAYYLKGGVSKEQAEELVQETMISIWNKADTFNSNQSKASTWIFTIARNKRIDALRKMKHAIPDPNDPTFIEADTSGPDQYLARQDQAKTVSSILKSLPEKQSALILKSFFEDKSHHDIAHETGIPVGTVKSRIRLALEKLRHLVAQKEDLI